MASASSWACASVRAPSPTDRHTSRLRASRAATGTWLTRVSRWSNDMVVPGLGPHQAKRHRSENEHSRLTPEGSYDVLRMFRCLLHITRFDGPSGLATGGPLSFQGPTAAWRWFLDRISGLARDRDCAFGTRGALLSNQGLVPLRIGAWLVPPSGPTRPSNPLCQPTKMIGSRACADSRSKVGKATREAQRYEIKYEFCLNGQMGFCPRTRLGLRVLGDLGPRAFGGLG